MAYMTGWRVDELLSLKRTDLNLKTGHSTTRYRDNKGKRDEVARLHQFVVDHLKPIKSFGELFFEWPHGYKSLWSEFHRIQQAASIWLECHEEHDHTDSCHFYGFHDLRRAFATENAENVNPLDLQRLMRHKSFTTTLRYINMAKKSKGEPTDKLQVPDLKRKTD